MTTEIVNIYCAGKAKWAEDHFIHATQGFSATVGFFLKKAFVKRGIEVNIVPIFSFHDAKKQAKINAFKPPKCDQSLITSSATMYCIKNHSDYRKKIRDSTKGVISLYLDADYEQWFPHFDVIFTVVRPREMSKPKCVYGGWGADPKYCYPAKKKENAAYMGNFPHANVWMGELMKKAKREGLGIKIYQPCETYHGCRVVWIELQKIFRKTRFVIDPSIGESGLTRIEAAYAGNLLVVNKRVYKPRTFNSLEFKAWDTIDELRKILQSKTNPQKIAKKARRNHSWDKVVERMLERFDNG